MKAKQNSTPQLCTALTQAGQPCRHLALPDSDPPLCDLHGMNWMEKAEHAREASYCGRYLASRGDEKMLSQLEDRSQIGELILAREMVARLVDHLQEPQADSAESKVFVPLIFRGIKLVSDLLKQLGSEGGGDQWDQVLDRLGDELDIDI